MIQNQSFRDSNILLITIDCLRGDHLGCYGYTKNTSPNLDALASKGILFSQAITAGGGTAEAFPAILFSALPPLSHQEFGDGAKWNTSLGEILKRNGCRTAGFHSNPYLSKLYHFDKGFDTFDDYLGERQSGMEAVRRKAISLLGRSNFWSFHIIKFYNKLRDLTGSIKPPCATAEEINMKSLSWLRKGRGKFFLWLHYMDVHQPCLPPTEYLNQFCPYPVSKAKILNLTAKTRHKPRKVSTKELEILISVYDACIRYVDRMVGQLFSELRKLGLLENTIIIVTADHGDEYGEHGFEHYGTYEAQIHIPLILKIPGANECKVVPRQVSNLDLVPTICDLVGIKRGEPFRGKSLVPLIRGEEKEGHPVVFSVALEKSPLYHDIYISCRTEEGWKYIYAIDYGEHGPEVSVELYNLKIDPGEKKNLKDIEEERAQWMESKIIGYMDEIKRDREKRKTMQQKMLIKQKLKQLKDSKII